jgi:hypothetical protein
MRRQYSTLVVLSLLSIPGAGTFAHAGDFFPCKAKVCDTDSNTQVIKLPPQHISVETVQPRVVVRDNRMLTGQFYQSAPMVATIFTPLTIPMPHSELRVDERSNLLAAIHEADQHLLTITKAKAAQQAELDMTNRAYQQHLDALSRTAEKAGTNTTTKTDLDARIVTELTNIRSRIEDLEKLVIKHDDVIKKMIADKQNEMQPVVPKK